MTTTETKAERITQVSHVEGHPIYFDNMDGKLYGSVRGTTLEHKTYSTLRKLMFAEHLRTLENIPALVVEVPEASHYRVTARATRAKLVHKQTGGGWNKSDRMVSSDGQRFDAEGKYAVVPEDAADVETIQVDLDAFEAEAATETQRHRDTMLEISERYVAYVSKLRDAYPESAMSARLPELKSEADRRAYYTSR